LQLLLCKLVKQPILRVYSVEMGLCLKESLLVEEPVS
jgi:hypothetical protein